MRKASKPEPPRQMILLTTYTKPVPVSFSCEHAGPRQVPGCADRSRASGAAYVCEVLCSANIMLVDVAFPHVASVVAVALAVLGVALGEGVQGELGVRVAARRDAAGGVAQLGVTQLGHQACTRAAGLSVCSLAVQLR